MLPGMSLYNLDGAGELVEPSMVVALDGWVDAGSAATVAAGAVVEGARVIATFDPDAIFDYRAQQTEARLR